MATPLLPDALWNLIEPLLPRGKAAIIRPRLPQGRLVRIAKRNSLADAATGNELRFGDELLPKIARLARGGHLAADTFRFAGLAGTLRAD